MKKGMDEGLEVKDKRIRELVAQNRRLSTLLGEVYMDWICLRNKESGCADVSEGIKKDLANRILEVLGFPRQPKGG